MRPWFTVGALAVAARRANVVGAVRATLMPEGLEIELMRVSGFAQGFAPGGVAEPVSFRVPYTAVRGLVREGRLLYLSFDPTVVAPYNRFALSRFVDDPGEALASAYLARARARWASLILPAPLGAVVAALVPTEMVSGPLGRTSVGLLAALLFFAILREIFAWSTWGGPRSSTLSERFEAELAERLALLPPPIERAPARMFARPVPARTRALAIPPPPPPVREPVAIPRPAASGAPDPATRLAWPIAAAACTALGIVGVMAFLERYAAPRPAPPAVEKLMTGLGAAARGVRLDVRAPPEPERCLCMRAESPLWAEGIPTLAVLTFRTDEDLPAPPAPELDRAGFPQMSFELAAVNNGARPLRDVQLTLTFSRRNADGKRVGAVDRGLFWEGVLAPGHAVKWHVSAPGSEMRIDLPVHGTLEKSRIDPAPANAFFGLTQSKFRAVRLHGAMMLAYLRDPRAPEAARSLSAQTAADEVVIGRVRRAAAPVIACEVHRENDRLEACLWNGASQPRGGLALREVGPGEPRSVPVTPVIPVHEGLRVTVDVPEGFADDLAVVDPQGPQ